MTITFNTLNKQYSFVIQFTSRLWRFTKLRDDEQDLIYCLSILGLYFCLSKRNWVAFDFTDSLFITKYYPYSIKYSQGIKEHNFFFDEIYGFSTIKKGFAETIENFEVNFENETFYGFVIEKATKFHNFIYGCKSFKIYFLIHNFLTI